MAIAEFFSAPVRCDRQLIDSGFHDNLLTEFNQNLDKLAEAIGDTRNAGALASRLKQSGGLTLFWGNITGGNQKDLAGMVQDLGASLETTQLALELVMKLQIRKHGVLSNFHNALVSKIESISKDTITLDSNQRAVAIAVISEMKDHVAAQIRYQDLVDEHEDKIEQLGEYAFAKNTQDAGRDERLNTLESKAIEFVRVHDALSARLDTVHEDQARINGVQVDRMSAARVAIDGLERDALSHQQRIAALNSEQQEWVGRLAQLESRLQSLTSIRAMIMRQLLPGGALLVGLAAIALHFAK